jgi:hypothetical protein
MSASEDSMVSLPPNGWTCFHCGETFIALEDARRHFGVDESYEPACIVRLQNSDKELIEAADAARREADEAIEARNAAEERADTAQSTLADLARYFEGATTPHQAWLVLDSMKGRALAAEEDAARLRAILRSVGA